MKTGGWRAGELYSIVTVCFMLAIPGEMGRSGGLGPIHDGRVEAPGRPGGDGGGVTISGEAGRWRALTVSRYGFQKDSPWSRTESIEGLMRGAEAWSVFLEDMSELAL